MNQKVRRRLLEAGLTGPEMDLGIDAHDRADGRESYSEFEWLRGAYMLRTLRGVPILGEEAQLAVDREGVERLNALHTRLLTHAGRMDAWHVPSIQEWLVQSGVPGQMAYQHTGYLINRAPMERNKPVPLPADIRASIPQLPLREYDHFIVCFSGGKDSLAMLLWLLQELRKEGIPWDRVELWHHLVDGAPGSVSVMDWRSTEGYVRQVAGSLGLPAYFSWREGGFIREMNRQEEATAPVTFESPEGTVTVGGLGPAGTRGKFPQVSADLSVRWCSPYLKIMVAGMALTNSPRFRGKKVALLTGERRQESSARARYADCEPHRSDGNVRTAHQIRPILDWPERDVWGIIRSWGFIPHPAYWVGFGRCSCQTCIFLGDSEWALLRKLDPDRVDMLSELERGTGLTIHRTQSIPERAGRSSPEILPHTRTLARIACNPYTLPVRVNPSGWVLPPGAYRDTPGPT